MNEVIGLWVEMPSFHPSIPVRWVMISGLTYDANYTVAVSYQWESQNKEEPILKGLMSIDFLQQLLKKGKFRSSPDWDGYDEYLLNGGQLEYSKWKQERGDLLLN